VERAARRARRLSAARVAVHRTPVALAPTVETRQTAVRRQRRRTAARRVAQVQQAVRVQPARALVAQVRLVR
jgi:hypothetical protein